MSIIKLLKRSNFLTDKKEEMKSKAQLLGQKIREARQAKGWSQDDLAKAVGISQPAIKDIEDGVTLRSRFIDDIITTLGMASEKRAIPQPSAPATDRKLPIYGTRETDTGSLMLTADPIDASPIPERLAGVPGSYGIYMSGESMAPRYREGDLLLIHPHLSPRPGDGVAVFTPDKRLAQIFEFVRSTATEWIMLRYKDAGLTVALDKTAWPVIEVVYGSYSRA